MYENNMWHPVSNNQAKLAICILNALIKKYGFGFENIYFHEDLCAKTDYEGRLVWIYIKKYLKNPPLGAKHAPYRTITRKPLSKERNPAALKILSNYPKEI